MVYLNWCKMKLPTSMKIQISGRVEKNKKIKIYVMCKKVLLFYLI